MENYYLSEYIDLLNYSASVCEFLYEKKTVYDEFNYYYFTLEKYLHSILNSGELHYKLKNEIKVRLKKDGDVFIYETLQELRIIYFLFNKQNTPKYGYCYNIVQPYNLEPNPQTINSFCREEKYFILSLILYQSLWTDIKFYCKALDIDFINTLNKYNYTYKPSQLLCMQRNDINQEELHSLTLPEELNTERACKYYNKALDKNLISQNGKNLKRNISKALLAYFTELVHCRDNEGKDTLLPYPETTINTLFNENRMSKARTQILNNKSGKPKGYKKIDSLFED